MLPDGSLFVEAGTELVNGFMCNKWVYKNTANNTHIDQTYTLVLLAVSINFLYFTVYLLVPVRLRFKRKVDPKLNFVIRKGVVVITDLK